MLKEKIKNFPFFYGLSRASKERVFWLYNKLTLYNLEKIRFYKNLGYKLNLKNPKSFNEKIVWKKIYDRNPLLPTTADKYKVRDYFKEMLGKEKAKEILIPLLYVTDKPETIPFEKLPSNFIIKANHGSGTNIVVRNGNYNKEEIIKTCKRWLKTPYGLEKNEWAYQKIKRKIVIEKLLKDEEGELPKDYKFHVFHGKCEMIQVNQGYFADKNNRTLTLYTPEWRKISVFWEFKSANSITKPSNLNKMIALAEKLSISFDYVRIDLYSINNRIFFGEFTHYPTSGIPKIDTPSFDFEIGKHWKIIPKYWKK